MTTPGTHWTVDQTMILTRQEIAAVVTDLNKKAKRSANSRINLVIFRLATCCGLRVSEIAGLRMSDVHVGVARPHIVIRKTVGKGGKARRVPLWWDGSTLADLTAWKAERTTAGATAADPFITSTRASAFGVASTGAPMTRQAVRSKFLTACKVLGADRVGLLTIHHGRHSFVSHALAGGRTLAEVKDAAGHSSISTTSIYTHIASDDGDTPGDLFAF